jgi:hypothetical protein
MTAPLKVGIVLATPAGDPGAWLADGVAFEAAGADALFVDSATELDPLALAAALAAVTYRSRLLVRVGEPVPDRTRDTLEALSRGRLTLVTVDDGADGTADAAAGADDDAAAADEGGWLAVPAPENRAAWRATVADAVERGIPGVLVPADPRMLDLLRNPEVEIDRRDLQVAQG